MWDLIVMIFYQPFLNVLVLIYWLLGKVMEEPDMGLAVIVFTVLIRLLLMPLTMAASQSEDERREIGRKFEEIELKYKSSEPLQFKQLKQDLIREHHSTIRFELINLGIQLVIALILWRVFDEGLKGADLHLLYSWMPKVDLPFNLVSFEGIDLTKPSIAMNLVSSALLFLLETLNLMFSPLPATAQDRLMQVLLPLIVFVYLYTMPAGKKFFIITTLSISILILLGREIYQVGALAINKKM